MVRHISLLAVLALSLLFRPFAGAVELPDYSFHTIPNTTYYGGIHGITKDRIGRIWFSGHEAVCVYDGNTFVRKEKEIMKMSPYDSWNFGEVRTAGKDCRLIVGSNHGMIMLDYESMSFDCLFPGNIGPFDVSRKGEVWMVRDGRVEMFNADDLSAGTFVPSFNPVPSFVSSVFCTEDEVYASVRNVLMKYNPDNCRFDRFSVIGGGNTEIKDVLRFGEDVYVLTLMDGLFKCRPDGTVLRSDVSGLISDSTTSTKMLYADPSGVIWIATQAGLLLLDPETERTRILRLDLNRPYSLPNNSVWSVFPDPDGGLWIGTYGGKLAYSTLSVSDVRFFTARSGGLSHPIVSCFVEDSDGNLWIGTEGGGISVLDRQSGRFSYHTHSDGCGLSSDFIKRLWRDEKGGIWVASFNGGIQVYDKRTGQFKTRAGTSTNYPLCVYDFLEWEDGSLWMSNPDGNLRYQRKAGSPDEAVWFTDSEGRQFGTAAEMIYRDDEGHLCLLSHSGLIVADTSTGRIVRCHHIDNVPFQSNNLICFCRLSSGDIWFGTGGGVNVLKNDGSYVHLVDSEGESLLGKVVFGIVEDDASGNVWLSTDAGLYLYSADTGLFSKSSIDNDENCGSYYIRSYFKTSRGEILFGGTSGFVMFNPVKMSFNSQKPEVFFTDFLIDNNVVLPGSKDSPLKKSILTYTSAENDKGLVLNHRQNNFGVRLSSDSYLNAERNRYAYRMQGLSDDWMELPEGQRVVSFFNIRPGKYLFEAKAANNDGIWGDRVTSIGIEVRPSPFLSVWAYCLYALILALSAFAVWRFFTNKKILEQKLQMERMKEENIRQMTQARINFFTSISHDLKTPLTLVVDPLKQLKEHLPQSSKAFADVRLIEQNVGRIKRMIVQLLQFREIESQKIVLNRQPGDIVRFIKDIFSLFDNIAANKEIETEFRSEMESFYTMFDYEVMEKIVTNLISNAFKYTPQGCFVRVALSRKPETDSETPEWLSIVVMNTGTEIPEDKRELIFNAFSKLPHHTEKMIEHSNGLGLAIVRELVDNLGGRISLTSGHSTVSFEILLPFAPDTDARTAKDEGGYEYAVSEADSLLSEASFEESVRKDSRKAYSVVVVEDDVNLRNYLEKRLSGQYNVYTATNGSDGIAKAIKVNPQLVVTDLMMPDSDGFEVCRKIRGDMRTSHIPVIVLSGAGNQDDNRVKAMESGASVFLDKPVDMDFLLKQADNLIRSQQKLKEMYSRRFIAEPSKVTISSMDEEILKRAMDHIERNMDNCDYDVDSFVSDMAIGRTILYRKINDITGMSIKEFILDVRLKRAAQLLRESEYTIAEISDMTGFANPKYFSICFRRHFSITPSEFRKG